MLINENCLGHSSFLGDKNKKKTRTFDDQTGAGRAMAPTVISSASAASLAQFVHSPSPAWHASAHRAADVSLRK